MSTLLYCSQCKQDLSPSKFTDEQQILDDNSRICIKCSNTNTKDPTKKSVTFSDHDNKEDDDGTGDTSKSPQILQQQQNDDVTFLRLYPNPKTKRWVKTTVIYVLQDKQTVVTFDLGNNNFKDEILSADESSKLVTFDPSLVGTIYDTNADNTSSENRVPNPQLTEGMVTHPKTVSVHSQQQNQLDRYMKIYHDLKSQNTDNTVDDETLRELARDEYNKIRSQQQTTQDESKKNFPELLLQEIQLEPFKTKFPKTHEQYWEYSHALENYKREFLAVPEQRLVQEILKSTSDEVRSSWMQYTEDQYTEIKHNYTEDQLNDPDIDLQLRQTFVTICNYESFIISRLDFNPDIIYFNKLLLKIYYGRNEMPLWFDQRFQRYWKHISIVRERLNNNPNLTCNLRRYTDQEQLEQYIRVCTHDNNTPDHDNDSVLNQKVKFKISQWLQKQSDITLHNFRLMLQTLHTNILPTGCGDSDGLSWKRYKFGGTVFQLQSSRNLAINKKRSNPFKTDGSKPKRQRLDEKLFNKDRCKGGSNCVYWLKNRKCRYQHTAKEIVIMNKKRSTQSQTPQPWSNKKRSKQHGKQKPLRPKCKFGAKCTNLPRGSCPYYHAWKNKQCTYCKNYGHFEFQCRRKAKAIDTKVQRYDPLVKQNPNPPNPHSLPLTSDNIQVFDGIPYQRVTRYEQVGIPSKISKTSLPMKINNEDRLDELKAIQRSAQQQITAIMKDKSGAQSQKSSFEEFMAKANQHN